MQTTIESVLNQKGHDVWSVSPEDTVYDAIGLMVEKRVEALLVLSSARLVGIVAHHDCSRRVTLRELNPKEVRVGSIMTSPVASVSPTHTVGDCMRIVTDTRVPHLPVVDDDVVVGVVSIGDLVKAVLDEQDRTIRHLEGYITGRYPG